MGSVRCRYSGCPSLLCLCVRRWRVERVLPQLVPVFVQRGDDPLSQILLQTLEILSEEQKTSTERFNVLVSITDSVGESYF